MSSVVPPSAPLPQAPASAGPVNVTIDAKAMQALASTAQAGAAQGALIEATAMARAAKGVVEVSTEAGTLTLKVLPPGQLPAIADGAKLLLQLEMRSGAPSLTLVGVNGRSLLGGPAVPGMNLGTASAGGTTPLLGGTAPGQAGALGLGRSPLLGGAPAGNPAVIGAAGQSATASPTMGLTATLVKPAMNAGSAPAGIPPLPGSGGLAPDMTAGTRLTVRIAGIDPPNAGQTGLPGQQNAGPGLNPSAPANPAQAAAARAAAASVGSGASAPGTVLPQTLPTAASGGPGILSGVVAAHPPGGQALVSTPIGTLTLPAPQALPVGAQLRLDVVDRPLPPAPAAPAAPKPAGLTAQGWPALAQTVDVLGNTDRQALDAMMRMIPQAGPRLAAGIAAFTGAMRAGDIKSVFGEQQSKALDKAGRRDLAERMKGDLSTLADDAGRPAGGGEWRVHAMPFMHGGEIDPIRLFVRGVGGEDKKRGGGGGNEQRFILDFNLTNLGRLQMDGLVRREEKLFDLIIRTDQALSQDMRMDIMAIFNDASELVGTKGGVAFQSGGRWIEIPDDPPPPLRVEA